MKVRNHRAEWVHKLTKIGESVRKKCRRMRQRKEHSWAPYAVFLTWRLMQRQMLVYKIQKQEKFEHALETTQF